MRDSKKSSSEVLVSVDGALHGWRVRALVESILSEIRIQGRRSRPLVLSIQFLNRSEMAKLNFQFRGKKQPTDILSFEQDFPSQKRSPALFLGDLVICTSFVKNEARLRSHSINQELSVLLVHGLLHLLGYDHEKSAAEMKKMLREESRILQKIWGNRAPVSGLIERVELLQ